MLSTNTFSNNNKVSKENKPGVAASVESTSRGSAGEPVSATKIILKIIHSTSKIRYNLYVKNVHLY